MENIIALVVCCLLGVEAKAQVQVQFRLLDSHTRQPIEFASVFNARGTLLTTSDSEGYIRFKDSVPKFSVSHVAYLNKDVDTDTLKDKVLYMDTREQALNEVLVATKRPEYVVFEAYFRAPQFYNGQLEYYYDGVAYYFVKLKNGEVDHRTLAARYLADDSIKKEECRNGSLLSYAPPFPVPDFYGVGKNKEAMNPAFWRTDTLAAKVLFSFDHLYPDTVKSLSLGKYNQQLRSSHSSEVYALRPDGITYTDMVSSRWSRQMTVTIKDVRKIYDQWEEVYITKASFAGKQDVKKLKDEKMGIVDVDQFIEQSAIPPISNSIRAKLPTMTATKR